jgi:hypothetical protein
MRFQVGWFVAGIFACFSVGSVAMAADPPVKVFILAGQSNMQGHAKVETFDYIGDDPVTAPLLKEMLGPDGTPRVCEGVWISYLTGMKEDNGEGFGKLTAGYGARKDPSEDGGKIGPEFTFGIEMDKAFDQPVLIIKTAWGGKSLFHDFRPPSAGPYERSEKDVEKDRYQQDKTGHYYRLMVSHVKHVLADIKRVCPSYDEAQGYEIAGFVWFQGWNDKVNRDVYPQASPAGKNRFAKYSQWMSDFIRDVRKDFDAPEMPFVIGVMGVGGDNPKENNREFREAMAAPAALAEFTGNVVAVPTAPFWDAKLGEIDSKQGQVKQMGRLLRTKNKNHANKDGKMTQREQREYVDRFAADLISPEEAAMRQRGASNARFHYLGCAKTFALMGKAYAQALLEMQEQ